MSYGQRDRPSSVMRYISQLLEPRYDAIPIATRRQHGEPSLLPLCNRREQARRRRRVRDDDLGAQRRALGGRLVPSGERERAGAALADARDRRAIERQRGVDVTRAAVV